jgi:hypothetical protein
LARRQCGYAKKSDKLTALHPDAQSLAAAAGPPDGRVSRGNAKATTTVDVAFRH